MTGLCIGHVHLKVRNLDISTAFYTRAFDLKLTERVANYAFLTGTHMHHEIALQALGENAPIPPRASVGLYHIAFEAPDKRSLAQAYQRLLDMGVEVHPVDHFISWAIYFDDPDGNGLELYCDTRTDPDGAKRWFGRNAPLTHDQLIAALTEPTT